MKNIDARLIWRTASEKNNDHFDVERSLNGTDFRKAGQVQGQGSKTTPTDYALTDAGIGTQASGTIYYRLRQVDSDSTARFSPVRTVTFATAAVATISLYPVPAAASTTLALTALPANQYYAVRITDLSGRQVGGYTLAGGQAHRLALAGIASGAYLVTLTGRDAQGQVLTITKRLIKE